MEDTKTEVLEQYDFQVNNSYRGRDARILDTDQGLLSLREYSGSQRKLQFQDSLLAPPVYTRPAEFRGWRVPDVLLSGNFSEIEAWQDEQSWERTRRLRPDLLDDKN